VLHVRAFGSWLATRVPEVGSPAGVTRTVLEDWLLSIRAGGLAAAGKAARVTAVRLFLEEQWDDGLAGLPRGATIHPGEVPHSRSEVPRGIEAPGFEQFIDPANLARLPNEQHRTVIGLLAFTGLRVSSVVTLPRDALQIGSDNHPYLRYVNVKLGREAVIPIGPVLREQLDRQERYINEIYGPEVDQLAAAVPAGGQEGPLAGRWPPHHAPDGPPDRQELCAPGRDPRQPGPVGELGSPAPIPPPSRQQPGQRGVPLSVIQRVLDHDSIEMTARYAHLDDETVKREMMSFHARVNIRGERIALPVGGPLEEAAWMNERIARAKPALPNGYCGLPLVRSCPHPNACLSCDNFLTDSSFRRIHERQLDHTQTLRQRAERNENVRLVELLETDERSLRRILEGLDAIEADHVEESASAQIEVIELAAKGNAKGRGDRS
jgi:site-specific recombinase XerD